MIRSRGPRARKVSSWLAALAACWLLAASATAQTRTLVYSAPCHGMRVWEAWDELLEAWVVNRDCSPGEALRHPVTVYLWKRPLGAGSVFARADSHYVQPCREDSFPAQGPGHYYLTARNAVGEACASNQVSLLPNVMTGVGLEAVRDPVVSALLFDVQGRRVGAFPGVVWYECIRAGGKMDNALLAKGVLKGRVAAGIYWLRGTTRDRALMVRRVVVVR